MKILNKTAFWTVVLLVLGLGLASWMYAAPRAATAVQKQAVTSEPAPAQPDTVSYAPGSPQLDMIRSQMLRGSTLPLGETLSARVAYDEDRTARVGVGISGRIVAIRAAPGEMVRTGQLLAEIDSPDVGSAHADLGKARADEERKRLAFERARELGAGEGIAAKDVEASQADYLSAKAETARADQRLRSLNPRGLAIAGQRIGLASPVSGVVTERTATPALEVNPGLATPLFVITDPHRLWLMIDVPEKLLARVKAGSVVSVESDAYPEDHFEAHIVQVGQVMDPNTRRVLARARLDNPSGKLLPEMLVRATVLQEGGTGVRAPNSAIVDRGVYSFVFVEVRPGEFERRRVQLLTRGADSSYVGEGLAGGERVVTTGALLLEAERATSADKP